PDGLALLTTGKSGLRRWPIRVRTEAGRETHHVGPAEVLKLPTQDLGTHSACWSREGQLILVADRLNNQALLWRGDRPGEPRLLPHRAVHYVALSPDGCWAATGAWRGDDTVKVWDTATGRQVQELPADGGNQVAFSPDGKWLGTGGGKYRFWDVPPWPEEAGLAGDPGPPPPLPR